MRIIGVVDLLGGRAVHARGGRRERYAPVQQMAGSSIADGDATAVAKTYLTKLGLTELYVADLDAILGGAWQTPLVAAVAALGAPLWLDAGVSSVAQARRALDLGARIIVGLETLPSFDVLGEICGAVGGGRVAFSLDLQNGQPVLAHAGLPEEPAHALAARAADAGAGAIVVLDLGRVGASTGLDLALISRVRKAVPQVRLMAGGGVRGAEDLVRLANAGCDGALVATALHDGRL